MESQHHRNRRAPAWRLPCAGGVAVLLFGFVGCAQPKTETGTVAGRVLIDGELAPRGQVTFHPVVEGPLLVGRVDEQGSFALRVGRGNPSNADASLVPVGDYKVTVVVTGDPRPPSQPGVPPGAGPRVMHAKYGSRDTSGLRRSIAPGRNLFDFDLLPAEPEDPAEPEESSEEIAEETAEESPDVDQPAGGVAGPGDGSDASGTPAEATTQAGEGKASEGEEQ